MTKFETIGVAYQHEAMSIEEANKSFKFSCKCCCAKGMRIDCDKCSIAHANALVVAYFNDKTIANINANVK